MVTDTFFDLQRFDDEPVTTTAVNDAPLIATNTPADTIVGSSVNGGTFTWQNGSTFVNDGTAEAPVYHLATTGGVSEVTGSMQIALNGTKAGYKFAVNEAKDDWDVSIKGSQNVITGDFSQGSGAYGLNGAADITVYKNRAFDEIVNNSATYVKNSSAADVAVNVKASGTDAMTYTFNGASSVAVGVDSNDTAVFKGGATNVTLGPVADADSMKVAGASFYGDATVTSNGTNVTIAAKENVPIYVDKKQWVFDNKSTRDVASVVAGSTGDVAAVSATKSADLYSSSGIDTAINVNIDGNTSTWNQITGDIENHLNENNQIDGGAIRFHKDGAHVNNYGPVTVKSASGSNVGFAMLDSVAGVVANDVTIKGATTGGISTFAVDLSEGGDLVGIDGIAVDNIDDIINVAGDKSFNVQVGKQTYKVETTADDITFDANTDTLVAQLVSGKEYSVTGGDALYFTNDVAKGGKASFGINGATVVINNNGTANDVYQLTSDEKKAGVDVVGFDSGSLKPNDAVSVTGDNDGFTAVYGKANGVDGSVVVSYAVNNANISVKAGFVDEDAVTITSDGGNNVTVQGIEGSELFDGVEKNAVITVSGDVTYHFKNALAKNIVTVGGAEYTEVTLTSGGDVLTNPTSGKVEDVIDDHAIPRKEADDKKWNERSTIGGSGDTVTVNHANVYEDFYNLTVNSAISGNTLAGYTSQNDTAPTAAESAINIVGESPMGTPTAIGGASHITLTGDSNIGRVPINIQADENPVATDVTVNLVNSAVPASVAVGTTGTVQAAHDIRIGSAGTQNTPSYVYLGENATGENKISATGGYNVLRHDGGSRASVFGGTGNDTIRGDVNDIVSGGASADVFYDYSGYALDYNVAEGDVIIASRLASIAELNNSGVIRGNGNSVGFGNGEYLLTLGNIDQNAQVHVKVATMDNDGNIMNGVRDVVLANGNGVVDATAAGTNGALIVADATRGAGVHAVFGSEGADIIQVGSYDAVSGVGGNDSINIDKGAVGVVVAMSAGADSVTGWNYGFDRAAGATQLNAGGAAVVGRVFEDRLLISMEGGAAMSFDDTAQLGNADQMHGEYKVLVDDKKLTGIRNGDAGAGYADIDSNDEIADAYFAEREGDIRFTANVTQDLGIINLADPATYQDIRKLTLYNNSNAIVMGSADRETVALGGAAVLGANKVVSLGGGNDVIISAGSDSLAAGHAFYFGAGDGRDSVSNYNYYQGINEDPDKAASDVIILQSLAGLKVDVDELNRTRVEFALNESDYAVVYGDATTYDVNRDMYHVLIGSSESDGIAKIGYSTTANYFTYDKEVDYYVGSSGESRDTLVINAINENVEVRMDGQKQDGKFYRGIGVIDASMASYTNTTLAGSAANNMIVAGGEGTNNFLWGGAGSNTLVGGAGKDFFLYTKNANAYVAGADHSDTSGTNDIITGYDCNNDVIILSDVTLADINYAAMAQAGGNYGITENAVTVALNNGGSVTVDPTGQSKVTFYINDGAGQLTAFTANRDTGAWSRG